MNKNNNFNDTMIQDEIELCYLINEFCNYNLDLNYLSMAQDSALEECSYTFAALKLQKNLPYEYGFEKKEEIEMLGREMSLLRLAAVACLKEQAELTMVVNDLEEVIAEYGCKPHIRRKLKNEIRITDFEGIR